LRQSEAEKERGLQDEDMRCYYRHASDQEKKICQKLDIRYDEAAETVFFKCSGIYDMRQEHSLYASDNP
jgi:hypothetical protein